MTTSPPFNGFIEQTPDLPWLDLAECAELDVDELDHFFVDAGKTISKRTIAMCRRCPVRRECLDHAYRHDIVSGYFGGMSPSRRRVLSRDEALAEIEAGAGG